jgi:hypothetical protein
MCCLTAVTGNTLMHHKCNKNVKEKQGMGLNKIMKKIKKGQNIWKKGQ